MDLSNHQTAAMQAPLRSLLLSALFAWTAPCPAAALEVTPVMHELAPARQALGMTVANRGAAVATVQVRAFAWTHDEEGREQLAAAPEVIVSPAIFNLDAGRVQTVRAMFAGSAAGQARNYRLLIDEIPATTAGAEPVRFALRLSVPVFRLAAAPTPAALSWRLDGSNRRLVAVNTGTTRERISDLALVSANGVTTAPSSAWGLYLLGDHSRSWSVDPAVLRPGDRWTLTALTDAGRIEVPLVVAP